LAVFTWGRGEDGQLGLGDTSDQDEPTYVDALRGVGVRQIACGSGHTVVLTTDGEVYTWGKQKQSEQTSAMSGFVLILICKRAQIRFFCLQVGAMTDG
jgi:alpha-tubulin suppressor-like RCC1 family protein